jgi:hypothetical protein
MPTIVSSQENSKGPSVNSSKELNYWLNELNAHLRAYFKFFGFSLEWRPERTASLTITVNGKARHFKKVDALVAKAPTLAGWNITALEDPRPIDFLLQKQIEKSGIHPGELFFSLDNDNAKGSCLTIYHPLCNSENEELILQLANSAVYNLLGERSFGTDIRRIEVDNLSEADSATIKKLEELPAFIGLGRSVMAIDGAGNLVVTV